MFSQTVIGILVILTSLVMLVLLARQLMLLRWYLVLRPCVTPFIYWNYYVAGVIPVGTPYVALLTLGGVFSAFGPNKKICPGKLVWMFLFLLFCLPSFVIAPSFLIGLSNLLKITSGIAAYLIAYNCINNKKNLKYLLVSIAVLAPIVPLVYGLYQYFTATGNLFTSIYHDPRRIASVFAMYNHFGEFLNVVTFLLLGMIVSKEFTKHRKWLFLLLAVVCVESLLAQNRGSWIGLVVGLLAAMVIYRRVMPIKYLIIGGLAVGILGGAYIIARFSMLNELSEYGGSQDTLSGRLSFGSYLLGKSFEKPFTGHGLGYIVTHLEQGIPHNDYLWIFFENGLLPALMYIFFHISNMLSHIRNRLTENWRWIQFSFMGLSVYFFMHSFLQNIAYNPSSFPFFMACLGASAKLVHLPEFPEDEAKPEQNTSLIR